MTNLWHVSEFVLSEGKWRFKHVSFEMSRKRAENKSRFLLHFQRKTYHEHFLSKLSAVTRCYLQMRWDLRFKFSWCSSSTVLVGPPRRNHSKTLLFIFFKIFLSHVIDNRSNLYRSTEFSFRRKWNREKKRENLPTESWEIVIGDSEKC